MKINAIITGATGMVGEGVLHECLNHLDVEKILVINRRPCGVSHPKLKEIIHADFQDFTPIHEQLTGYNACYFCMGVSSVGLKEDQYRKLTYDITLGLAKLLSGVNTGMTFCYVSGAGTRSDEKGSMWAILLFRLVVSGNQGTGRCMYTQRSWDRDDPLHAKRLW